MHIVNVPMFGASYCTWIPTAQASSSTKKNKKNNILITESQKWREDLPSQVQIDINRFAQQELYGQLLFQGSLFSNSVHALKPSVTPESISDSTAFRDA